MPSNMAKHLAARAWRAMTAGGITLYRGGYFGKQAKDRFHVDKVADLPIFRQLYREAMSTPPAYNSIHVDDVDKLIEVASRYDVPIVLVEPDSDADEPVVT